MGNLLFDEYGYVNLPKLALWSLLTLLSGCGACKCANDFEYSQGIRTGMINKFSHKGLIWKTYEGQMALEGIVSGGESMGANVWDFSLDNNREHGENIDSLTKQIQHYLESGTKVKMKYVEPFTTWPWRSSTDYLIQNVEPIKPVKK